jgi:hypothetical protein
VSRLVFSLRLDVGARPDNGNRIQFWRSLSTPPCPVNSSMQDGDSCLLSIFMIDIKMLSYLCWYSQLLCRILLYLLVFHALYPVGNICVYSSTFCLIAAILAVKWYAVSRSVFSLRLDVRGVGSITVTEYNFGYLSPLSGPEFPYVVWVFLDDMQFPQSVWLS